jgi:hypothetical protein
VPGGGAPGGPPGAAPGSAPGAAAARRATAPGAPLGGFGGGLTGPLFGSLPSTPEGGALAACAPPPLFGAGSSSGFSGSGPSGSSGGSGTSGGGGGGGGGSGASAFEAAQRAGGGEALAAVARALSPECPRGGGSPAPWVSSSMAEAWDAASSEASRSAASSPDRAPAGRGGWGAWGAIGGGAAGSGAGGGAAGIGGGGASIDLGSLARAGRRGVAGSEPGLTSRSGLGLSGLSGLSVTLPECGTPRGNAGAAAAAAAAAELGDDSDALCVVEVAMAAAVEATTRPPRGGRGGKHRQKAKLNQSLQQLAGHADAGAAQAYVDTCLAAYKKRHPGDPAALELLTRHLAYLIGGVVRFKLEGLIPWGDLPVPAPHELADKSRTPTYKSWLCRLGVVAPEVFSDGGADSPCGPPLTPGPLA